MCSCTYSAACTPRLRPSPAPCAARPSGPPIWSRCALSWRGRGAPRPAVVRWWSKLPPRQPGARWTFWPPTRAPTAACASAGTPRRPFAPPTHLLPPPTGRALPLLDPDTGADRRLSVVWNSSLTLRPVKARFRPCGYWLAASATAAVERLKQLGLQVMRIAEPGAMLAETYLETARE